MQKNFYIKQGGVVTCQNGSAYLVWIGLLFIEYSLCKAGLLPALSRLAHYKRLAFSFKIRYTVNPTLKHQTYKVWYNKMGGV